MLLFLNNPKEIFEEANAAVDESIKLLSLTRKSSENSKLLNGLTQDQESAQQLSMISGDWALNP